MTQIERASQANSQRMSAVPFTRVNIDDKFWTARLHANREGTIPANHQQCDTTGRFTALKLQWKEGQPNKPHIFWDSDVAKWVEAACYSLASFPDANLARQVDEVVDLIISAQQADGYLNSYFSGVEPQKRWSNLRDNHELYCAGHLMEAAVAHFQVTGSRKLIDALSRYADHIASVFGTAAGQKRGYPGHEEIELALVKMFRATGERKFLRLAEYFVDERGNQPHYYDIEAHARGDDPKKWSHKSYEYCQAHLPVRQQSQVTGHSVRATYLYSAMADLAAETQDQGLIDAGERLWKHATEKLMYISGGIGSSRHNEGFTFDYDLPNETAYAETCAAIGFVMWNHRLLLLNCDSKYADVMERALYNGVLAGVSLDGRKFFYDNPLASVGNHHRQDWFGCACCPPNMARLLASLGGYIFSEGESSAAVHLYVQSAADLHIGGQVVKLRQRGDYPWDGTMAIDISPQTPARFALKLRRPDWCRRARISLNGATIDPQIVRGYWTIEREWKPGDTLHVDLAMDVLMMRAHPSVRMNTGRVALQRGPLVYCLEQSDNGPDLNSIRLLPGERTIANFESDLLGGVMTLQFKAMKESKTCWENQLYKPQSAEEIETTVTAVPYCLWDNREPGEMLVWIREK